MRDPDCICNMATYISHSEDETKQIAQGFVTHLQKGDVVCLYGELGAGKTVFVKEVLKCLGYTGDVTSPTFTLVHEYTTDTALVYHLDLYRIESEEQLIDLGVVDLFGTKETLFFIEWPEKLGTYLPKNRIDIFFADTGMNTRKIVIDFVDKSRVS